MPPGFKTEKHSLMDVGILWNGTADRVNIWHITQEKKQLRYQNDDTFVMESEYKDRPCSMQKFRVLISEKGSSRIEDS